MVLPDTSAWVEFLRLGAGGRAAGLDSLVDRREIVICGPVAAELIAGTSERDRGKVARVIDGLPWIELRRPDWVRVGELASALRAQGSTVPLTEIEIAVAAIGAKAAVWTGDSDFARIVDIAPELRLRRL